MRACLTACAVACAVVLAAPTACAAESTSAPSVQALLQRMSHALETLNYSGTFVYLHDGDVEAMHVVHRFHDGDSQERLTSLTGPPREVIRKHKVVECILARKRLVVVDKSGLETHFPIIMLEAAQAADLPKYYNFVRLGTQRTAGRDSAVIALKPKDRYRYGYRLWLDLKTAMLLRSELVDDRGRTVERVMFTHLEFPREISPAALAPTIDSAGFDHRARHSRVLASAGSDVVIHVSDPPPGYALTTDELQNLSGIDGPVRHLVFTDGLASLSVFAVPFKPGRDALRGASSMGSVNAFGRVQSGYRITVVGDVPAATVKQVAQSVRIETKTH